MQWATTREDAEAERQGSAAVGGPQSTERNPPPGAPHRQLHAFVGRGLAWCWARFTGLGSGTASASVVCSR